MDFQELEETISRLPSVNAVRIAGSRDEIREVHVLAAPEKAHPNRSYGTSRRSLSPGSA